MEDTQETEDVPPLAACVNTLPEAVQLSLKHGLNKDCLFTFARALKAFEITHNRRLPPVELQAAFAQWWNAAKPLLQSDADFDEWRFDFQATFAKTNAPLGSNSLQEAIRRADAGLMPPQAERYTSPKLKYLVAVCYHLQLLQGNSPFFMGVRDAAKILGTKDLNYANAMLAGLVRDGILIEVEKGTRRRATRFRFIMPETPPAGETPTPAPAKVVCRDTPATPALPETNIKPKSAKPSVRRIPRPHEDSTPEVSAKTFIEQLRRACD